jgi:DHA2 family multidrug resistance protein
MREGPTIEALRARYGDRYKWYALGTVMVGAVAAILTSTMVNVAIPQLAADYRIGKERLQWVSTAYMAAMTVTMLLPAWTITRFGFRRTHFAGVTLLFLGSLLGALSASFPMLVAMRVVQGAAAGLLQPLAAILILRAFPSGGQGRALGLYGFGVVLAPAMGPSIGGWLVDSYGWRSIFFVPLPFALLGALIGRRMLPLRPPQPTADQRPLDLMSLAALTVLVVALLQTFVALHDHGLFEIDTLARAAVAAAALGALVAWTRRHATPLIDPAVFGFGPLEAGMVVAFTYGMGLFGSTFLIPVFMQEVLHHSATESGAMLVPAGIALALTIPLAGRLSDTIAPRRLIMAGLACFGLSFALLALPWGSGSAARIVMLLVLGRVGLGLILPSLSLGSLHGIEHKLIPQGASLVNFMRQLGGAVGTGAITVFVEWRANALEAAGMAPAAAANRSFSEGFAILAVLFAIATVAAWWMKAPPAAGREYPDPGG